MISSIVCLKYHPDTFRQLNRLSNFKEHFFAYAIYPDDILFDVLYDSAFRPGASMQCQRVKFQDRRNLQRDFSVHAE